MLCHKPAYDFSFFKILAAFFATTFPYLVIDQVFTALLFSTLLFYRTININIFFIVLLLHFTNQKGSFWLFFFLAFFHLTEEKMYLHNLPHRFLDYHSHFLSDAHFWNLSLHFILTFLSLLFNFPGIALNIAQGNREILSISVR